MNETLLMAVDLGTSFIKAAVYNTQGECLCDHSAPVKDYRPSPSVFIQKGDELFASVVECMREASVKLGGRAAQIEAIAFTGQMSGFIGVDAHWEDVTTWSCSLDSRYVPYAKKQFERLRDQFLRISGTNFPQMAPKFAWYQAEFPGEAKRIAKYLMISGYVIGKLGNLPIEDAVIDRSYTSWTGLADIRRHCWSEEICDAIGLDQTFLPRIVGSNEICGKLSPEMARIVNLPSGIPLVSGAGDKITGCLGAAVVEDGETILEASSYGEISCCVSDIRPDEEQRRLDYLPAAIDGKYYATHFAAGSGITLDWFVDTFARQTGQSKGEAFAAIEEKIKDLMPGSDGLMAIGLLGGSSMPPNDNLRGLFMGHTWSHKAEHFYHALLESFTYDLSLPLERIYAMYPELNASLPVKMIGGGAKSPKWMQMSADMEARPYVTINRKDVSMWGTCLLAGSAVGIYPDVAKAAREHVQTVRSFTPNPQLRPAYLAHRSLYRDYLVELDGFYQRIAERQKT